MKTGYIIVIVIVVLILIYVLTCTTLILSHQIVRSYNYVTKEKVYEKAPITSKGIDESKLN